jgi:hypothetical protein
MVVDFCHSCIRPATPLSEKSRITKLKRRGRGAKTRLLARAQVEIKLIKIRPAAARDNIELRNKTAGIRSENTLISASTSKRPAILTC